MGRRGTVRRIRMYGALTFAAIIAGVSGLNLYAYERLQPAHHFQHLPVLGTNVPLVPVNTLVTSVTRHAGRTQSAKTSTSTPTANKPTYVLPPGVFNVLFIGSDERHGSTAGHSDSMMVIHVDLRTHQYNVLSIPRDSRVYLAGYGYTKLTSVQYIGQATHGTVPGILNTIRSITQLTGLPINYYAETDYWGLRDIVNAVGGIDMYIPFNVTITHPWYPQDAGKFIPQGEHFFTGRMVTEIAHERFSVPGTDFGRQRLQEEAMVGIAKALLTPAHLTRLPAFLRQVPQYLVATNMSIPDVLSLALANRHFQASDIHYYQIPGTSKLMYDDILKNNNDQVILNISAMRQIIASHFVAN